MSIRKIVSGAALVLTLTAGIVWAAAPGGAGQPGGQPNRGMGAGGAGGPGGAGRGRGAGAPMNLGQAMSDMGRLLRTLTAEATDFTKSDQTLKDIAQFQRDVAICKMQTPPAPVQQEDAAKAAASYKKLMSGLMRTLVDMEDHVDAKSADDVKKDLEKLGQIEKDGHTEFRG